MMRVAAFLIATLVTNSAALDNGVALTPPRGFSTWNAWPDHMKGASGNSIDHATASQYLRGMVDAGLHKLNYTYFIVDEPCFVGRDADGTLIENKTTWPNGLKAFAAELDQYGMKLGIYTCVGPKTCGGCVASEGHEEQDMRTFVDWGARYVKVDSCSRNCTKAAGVANQTECGQILWSRYTRALNATGVPVVYSIVCNCDPGRGDQPWKWAAPYANSWRTNIDIQVGFQAIPYIVDAQRRMAGNGTWCPSNPSDPSGPGVPCGGHGGPEQFSGIGHWNDMDMLIIGTKSALFPRPLNEPQSRAQLSLWAALKSPLLVSADLTNVSQPLIDILRNTEVLAISDDVLGREAIRLEDQPHSTSVGEIYAGPIVGGFVVVMFNRGGAPAPMELHLADVVPQSNGGASWSIRDLWAHASRGTVAANGKFAATVPPQDVVMITLKQVQGHDARSHSENSVHNWLSL